jgi:guanylate kinase
MNTLFAITAPSGSGKTSIMRSVMTNEVVSFTTRPMRDGEKEGVDYLFITPTKFGELKADGQLIEETCYSGNYYGITAEELEKKIKKGNAFVIVDHHGMEQLKRIYPNVVTIFIKTAKEDCMKNMFNRGDSLANIQKRLRTFEIEQSKRIEYDYVVTNVYGKKNETVNIISNIIYSYRTT